MSDLDPEFGTWSVLPALRLPPRLFSFDEETESRIRAGPFGGAIGGENLADDLRGDASGVVAHRLAPLVSDNADHIPHQ